MMIKRNVLLNPGPVTTTDTVKQALMVPDVCPRESEFKTLMARVRRRLVDVVHGGDEYAAVIFAGSGTAAVEACISSVVPHGKAVLIVDNGGYGHRMREIAQVYQIDVVPYSIPWGEYPDLGAVESLLSQHRGRVSHLAIVHHETTTGMLNPVAACASLAHQYGAEIIVDGMSSYAGIPIDIGELELDYLAASSSKCIQGMANLSFVICLRKSLQKCAQVQPRSYYLDLNAQHCFFEAESCVRFTAPVQLFYALDQALTEYFEETEQGRHQRYEENYTELVNGIRQLGFRFLLPADQHSRLATTLIEPTHPAYSYGEMHDYMYERGFTIYPDKGATEGAFRLANIGEIDREDIGAFLNALKEYLVQASLIDHLYDDE